MYPGTNELTYIDISQTRSVLSYDVNGFASQGNRKACMQRIDHIE
ncbi:hypothetical protein L249_1808, partial [Ophiocordyceps polyrhachis-furcata BCC 54312]